jgi:Tfp pilus assembly major pilin PilA
MKTIEVYQKYYPRSREIEAVTDVYQQLKEHQVDSLALNKWLTLQANNDDGYILQKTSSAQENEKTSWRFIYTKHVLSDTSFYSIKVLVSTKDKKLQHFYGR